METLTPTSRILELPYPPSVNHIWRRMGSRTVISREGRRYRTEVCAALAAVRGRAFTGRLVVSMVICPPDRRRRDLDNTQKAILDALSHAGIYHDDSQIDRLILERGPVTPGGKVIIELSAMSAEARRSLP